MQKEQIAGKLYKLRTQHGYSQENVATALRFTQKAYSNIESGNTTFKFEYVEPLATFYKVEPIDLCEYLLTESKPIIQKVADTNNGAFTAQGSVVQNLGIDNERLNVLFDELKQCQEINKYLLEELKALKNQQIQNI